MATPFQRFRSKYLLAWDALQRIGHPDSITEDGAERNQTYWEGQLGRVVINAQRASNYLSEMQAPGTMDTEEIDPAEPPAIGDQFDDLVRQMDKENRRLRKAGNGNNGNGDGEVKP